MKTALVTGANGFIGSYLVYHLLAQGWRVEALGRGNKTLSWDQRVQAALREIGRIRDLPGRLHALEFDLCAPNPDHEGGLPGSSPAPAILFHLAGDTRFRPSNPEAQRRVNIQAPLNLVATLKHRISRMVHVSTAYVAGKRSGLILEADLDRGQEFWNAYEHSKFDGEVAIAGACAELDIPLVIVRPSIIINDRLSGRAATFTHLNALVEVVSRVQDYYGISDGEAVSKKIRLLASRDARPNLAPVDSIVPPLLRIAESSSATGKVFHLCHPQPQTNAEIMGAIRDAYDVSHLLDLEFVEGILPPLSYTEEIAARALKAYAPYMNNVVEFDLRNSRSVVPDYDSYFSALDRNYVRKVIAFQRGRRQR